MLFFLFLCDAFALDEPTTGLDSSIAYEVLATVQTLTHYNRTILCTIHQPSLRAFNLFDSILLLAQGRLIYCGPTKDIIAHFRSCPYRFQCPSDVNPADFIIDIAMGTAPRGDPSRVTAEDLERVFETSPQGEDLHDRTHNASASLIIGSTWVLDGTARDKSNSGGILGLIGWAPSLKATTSLTHQLQTLLHRRLLQKIRNMHQLVATFGRYIAIALFYGTVYYQLPNGDSSNAYNNRLAIIFFSLLLVLMGHQEDIPSNLEDRLLFYRERAASAYGSLAYWLSSVLITVPYSSFMVFLYSLVVYWMIGFRPDLQRFGYFVYIMIVTDIIGYMVCQLVSNLSSSAEIAMSFFPVAMFFATAFEGFIVYLPQFPDWLGWGGYVSYMRFSFQALVLNEFQDNPKLPLASSYLSLLGFHSFDRADCAGLLWVFVVMHTLASFYCLIRFNFEKR